MTLCVLLESLNWFDVSYGVICRSSCTSRLSPLYSNQQTSVVLDRRSATGQKWTLAAFFISISAIPLTRVGGSQVHLASHPAEQHVL